MESAESKLNSIWPFEQDGHHPTYKQLWRPSLKGCLSYLGLLSHQHGSTETSGAAIFTRPMMGCLLSLIQPRTEAIGKSISP